jgi:transcriptional regulator with XRE-family HTH domain
VDVDEVDADAPRPLADRLNQLFDTIHPAGRGPFSNDEVAAAIRDAGGPTISATYIWMIRRGDRDNPTLKHLEALAAFFGIPAAYFFDDAASAKIEAELRVLAALRDSGVRSLVLRMSGLSARSLQPIADVIDRVRELEGLEGERPDG